MGFDREGSGKKNEVTTFPGKRVRFDEVNAGTFDRTRPGMMACEKTWIAFPEPATFFSLFMTEICFTEFDQFESRRRCLQNMRGTRQHGFDSRTA